ncbi:DUF1707 domain-containing protein [Thermopolyspora sp. NPDC052614]|uniref:DUF1707 SHOCT-like domain-containing protein n=1 Tax=Thermopolyspora sp. NPDC052614 TaxID=3155682 RepID=UPI00341500D7
MPDHRELRASDHDRERVVETLREAAGDGRITLEELNERADLAYTARTLGELERVVADLRPAETGEPALAAEPAGLRLRSHGPKVVQAGRWTVPRTLTAEASRWGTVKIDFTSADCRHREIVVEVDITSWFADIVITVPRGWVVHDDQVVRRRLGAVFNRPRTPLAPDGVTVRLVGTVRTGDVWVRYR